MAILHGGPDAAGAARWDFSTNANACGPAPLVLDDVDPTRYPDPASTALRETLAAYHRVAPERIVVAASASEFIGRVSTAVALQAPGAGVAAPLPGYGDYRAAAEARGLVEAHPDAAALVWQTLPDSPRGRCPALPPGPALQVIDCAYLPLLLDGAPPELPAAAWQLWSPNKALGLTGVRGAYAVAPPADPWRERVEALAPSWPLGAHGVAMLRAWTAPATQHWLQAALVTLRRWKARQLDLCTSLGWQCEASDTPFFVVRAPGLVERLPALRRHGIQLRDTASMGLPGAVRISVQPPAAQDALLRAWLETRP